MRFRYARDPLSLASCFLYLLNRLVLKPHFPSHILHWYFNDLLLIPCALPLILWLQRKLKLRLHDLPPTASEIFFHLAIWSILFEIISPHLIHATGDPVDVIAYCFGGLFSWVFWNKKKIILSSSLSNFNFIAPFYRKLQFLFDGYTLQKCRTEWIQELKGSSKILVLGEGPGQLLEALIKTSPSSEIFCIDSSIAMLREAQRSVEKLKTNTAQIHFIHATLPSDKLPEGPYDGVITPFFLDCLSDENLQKTISFTAQQLKPGGRWLLSDFCIPPRGFSRWRAKIMLFFAYRFFKLTTGLSNQSLTNPDRYLAQNQMRLFKRKHYQQGLLHSDLWIKRDHSTDNDQTIDNPRIDSTN
ncbi:MAG: class I SAM-dependent methyltransferase [Verrucomicrobiota bacterium]